MKRFFFYCISFFASFLSFYVQGQALSIHEESYNDVRSVVLGDVRALSNGLTNPAFVSFLNNRQVSAGAYNRFQMSELNTGSLSLLFPNRIVDAGIQLTHFGYEDYSLSTLETGLAKKLSSNVSLGAKIRYYNRSTFMDEQPESGLKAGIGFRIRLSSSIGIGLLAENLATTFDEKDYSFHAGVDYQVIDACHILFEISSDHRNNMNISIGTDYAITEELWFRAGFRTDSSTPSLGAAYSFDRFTVGVGYLLHQTLGASGVIEVAYSF